MEQYEKKNRKLSRVNRRNKNATRQEGVLWHCFLKNCSVNFSRQYPVGNYILDFYAPSAKLAIELDGGQHYEESAIEYDKKRSDYLNSHGIYVLRFSNKDIDKNLKGCIQQIAEIIKMLIGVDIFI